MARVKVTKKVNSDYVLSIFNILKHFDSTSPLPPESFAIVDDDTGNSLRIEGDNFKFAGGLPTKGVVTSITIHEGGQDVVVIDGFGIPLKALATAAFSGSLEAVMKLFGAFQFTGNNLNDVGVTLFENDTLKGLAGDDLLDSGLGDDSLSGGSGNDTLVGGRGADTLSGGTQKPDVTHVGDIASYIDSETGVTVDLDRTSLNRGDARGDVYSSIEGVIGSDHNDFIYTTEKGDLIAGLAGRDRLFGRGGHDTLEGGDHGDSLHGGADSDALRGGPGADRFLFLEGNEGGTSGDFLLDFNAAEGDKIVIDRSGFGGNLTGTRLVQGVNFFNAIPGGPDYDDGLFVFDETYDALYWFEHGNTSSTYELLLQSPSVDLTTKDFLLVA